MGLSVIRGGNGTSKWDEAAERSVIGAVMLRPESIRRVKLAPEDYYDGRNQAIWGAMLELDRTGKGIDTVLVEAALGTVVGPQRAQAVLLHLSECVGLVPTADNIEHYAAIVADHAQQRRVVLATADVLERAKRGDLDGKDLAEYAQEILWPALKQRALPPASAVAMSWRPLELAYLTDVPLARRWLLRHPTRDGKPAPPNGGDGLLPLGKVGILAAAGGVGKTMAVMSLAVATITGRRWLGFFEVDWEARQGKVLLALAEEDHEEVHRRLYAIAELYRLTAEERRRVSEQLVVLPLSGKPVGLVQRTADGGTSSTPELLDLKRLLHEHAGEHGWSLLVLDPLARWAGGADVEAESTVATRFVQALEELAQMPGFPTVLVPHHTSKMARRTGTADVRGVTAISDGARWAGTIRVEGADAYFALDKSNYSRPMLEELHLVRDDGGLLRVPSDDEIERYTAARDARDEEREAQKRERDDDKIARIADDLLAALGRAVGPITSQEQLKGLVSGAGALRSAAIARLMSSGRMVMQTQNGTKRYVRAS